MVSGRARLQSLRKNSVSYQGMPLGIPQVAEIGSGFSRCWQRNNSIHAGFGKGTASGCGKTPVLDFALKGRGFSRAVSVAKSMAALAAEGPAVYFFLTCGSLARSRQTEASSHRPPRKGSPARFSRGQYPRGAGRKPASPERSSRPAFPFPERSRHIRPGRQSRRPAPGATVCSGYKIQCSWHYDTRTKRSRWQPAPREDYTVEERASRPFSGRRRPALDPEGLSSFSRFCYRRRSPTT
jgi:hypothetical protein